MKLRRFALSSMGISLALLSMSDSAAPQQREEKPVGMIIKISGPAYWKPRGSGAPKRLDSKIDVNRPLYPEEGLRCDPDCLLTVELYGDKHTISPSDNWFLIPYAAGPGAGPGLRGGAAPAEGPPPSAPPSGGSKGRGLYGELGGREAISEIVDQFGDVVSNDRRLASLIARIGSDEKQVRAFKGNISNLLCEISDGSCAGVERSIKELTSLGISDKEFDALSDDLRKSLVVVAVDRSVKNELVRRFDRMKADIAKNK